MLYDIIVTTLFIGWGVFALVASIFWLVMSITHRHARGQLVRK